MDFILNRNEHKRYSRARSAVIYPRPPVQNGFINIPTTSMLNIFSIAYFKKICIFLYISYFFDTQNGTLISLAVLLNVMLNFYCCTSPPPDNGNDGKL